MPAHTSYDWLIALPRGLGRALGRLRRCTRGAVSLEYLVVVVVMGLSLAITLVGVGADVVQTWAYARGVLYGASP